MPSILQYKNFQSIKVFSEGATFYAEAGLINFKRESGKAKIHFSMLLYVSWA